MKTKKFPKHYLAQELFNRYIRLKKQIADIQFEINTKMANDEDITDLKNILGDKIEEFKEVFNKMITSEVNFLPEDLMLLSLNVEVYDRN